MDTPEYIGPWMGSKWKVVSPSPTNDPAFADLMRFTAQMTIERCQDTTPTPTLVDVWATGCTVEADGLHGTTTDGSWSFVIERDPNTATLNCTLTNLAARRQRRRRVLLGSISGALVGLLTGLAIGVPPVEAVAVGLSASFLSALMASTYPEQKVGDTWVANDGNGGLPPPPDTSTDGTERRIKSSPLRPAEA